MLAIGHVILISQVLKGSRDLSAVWTLTINFWFSVNTALLLNKHGWHFVILTVEEGGVQLSDYFGH